MITNSMPEKKLFIIRHGKASWKLEDIDDFDRSLTERGINNAYQIASQIKTKLSLPISMVSSPANRALHTSIIFARTIQFPLDKLVINDSFYEFSGKNEILNLIQTTSNSINTLLIFGHNPTFTDLANVFLKEKILELPTSGCVIITFETENWLNISKDIVKSIKFVFPE